MTSSGTALIVHDDADTRLRLSVFVRQAGFDVTDMACEHASARRLVELSPDVVVAEIGRDPKRLDWLRKATRDDDAPPVIALLHQGAEDELHRALDLGAADFVTEPVRGPELVARLRSQSRLRRTLSELEREKADAEVMVELTQTLSSSLDFRDILYTVVRRVAEVIDVARVSVVLSPTTDDDGVGYVVVTSDDERVANLPLDLHKYPEIKQVLRTRVPLTISDVSTHPVFDGVRESVNDTSLAAMSLFPLVWEAQAIGVLFLRFHREGDVLSRREVHFCQIVANATAVALRNARVMQSLRDQTQEVTFARFEAERRLRGLKRYADLFASAAEGLAAIDTAGRLLFANPRAYQIVGRAVDSLDGERVVEILQEDQHSNARGLWAGFARGEFPRGVDLKIARPAGDEVVVSASFAPLHDDEGVVLISMADVTEQRITEEQLVKTMEFLESLVDASVDGIIASDMDGNIILFNPAAERIYGYRAIDVIGKMTAHVLYPEGGAREVMRRIRADDHGGVGRLEPTLMEAMGRDGERIPIQLSAAMIYERGKPVATFGIFTDLREKMRIEARLEETRKKLAVSERQAVVAEVAGTAAHELNQPLTSVIACAELIKRRADEGATERRLADILTQEVERMAEIVRKIGTITRYETKSYVGDQQILDLDRSSGSQSYRPGESSDG